MTILTILTTNFKNRCCFCENNWEKFVSSEKSCIFAEKMEGYEKALYQ